MKKLFLFFVILILAGAGYYYFYGRPAYTGALSFDQEETRELLGAPAQFKISYLPQGEDGTFVRSETWYYPGAGKAVSFLGGRLLAAQDFDADQELPASSLRPEDFDADMTYGDVSARLGKEAILFDWPGFAGEGADTYLSDQAVFTIENGYLTYIETIGTKKVAEEDD